MRAPTHAVFGLVFPILAGTVLGLWLTPLLGACAIAGSLLPDVDSPRALAGRLSPPLARALARRFGHRTVTHSLLGWAVATIAALPLAALTPQAALAFSLGYLGHVLLDALNTPGVPLFYPSPVRAVLPASERLRLPLGARAEWALLAVLLVLLAALLPLHHLGFARSLHAVTRTPGGAIADYRAWEGRHEVWADVEATFRLSQRRVRQRYRVLGVASTSTLVLLDPQTDRIHTLGPSESATLHPVAIRAHAGAPVRVDTRPVVLTQRLLPDLLREVPPDGETFLHGTVQTTDTPILRPDPEQYPVVKAGQHALELHFARPRDLATPELQGVFVLSGLILVQTIRRAGPPAPATPAARVATPPAYDDVTQLFIAHVLDPGRELLVQAGDAVHRGQLLARLTWQDPELARNGEQAAAQLAAREAAFAVQATSEHQARALLAAQLVPPGTLAREAAALLRAEEAVAETRRALARLADEARRLSEVRSPVDGQVLSLRVHVIHGSEGTAELRLLYRKPTSPGV
jgi:inner membrane protein